MGFLSWLFCAILVVALVLLLFPFAFRIDFEAGERGVRALFFFFKKKIYEYEKKWKEEAGSKELAVEGDDKCVDRESRPSSLGHDRDQHLGQERSDCPKTKDERGSALRLGSGTLSSTLCHPGAEGDRIQESDNVAMSVRQALLTSQSAAEMLDRLMRGERSAPTVTRYQPLCVETRGSTFGFGSADPLVAQTLARIEEANGMRIHPAAWTVRMAMATNEMNVNSR